MLQISVLLKTAIIDTSTRKVRIIDIVGCGVRIKQKGQHPVTAQRAANFRLSFL